MEESVIDVEVKEEKRPLEFPYGITYEEILDIESAALARVIRELQIIEVCKIINNIPSPRPRNNLELGLELTTSFLQSLSWGLIVAGIMSTLAKK